MQLITDISIFFSSSTLLLKTHGQNAAKTTFLEFYYHLSYTWVDLICWTCLIFLNSPWWPVWTFYAQNLTTLKVLYWILWLSVVKCRAILNEHPSVAASISEYLWSKILERSPKFSEVLTVVKHNKKILWWSILKKKTF